MRDSFWQKIIGFLFALLFFLVPLFFTPYNFELFEFNKMVLVYAFTVLIVASWVGRMIWQGRILFKRTPLDLPLLIFLASQIISTLFSIDRHTSFWGYYSRFNGGLLSLISYLLLYWALVSNSQRENIQKFLKVSLFSAATISLYGILEHFGHSFSCLMFEGNFGVSCWIQDVQARVFATIGQPNWLAAYLAILIPIAIVYLLAAKNKRSFAYYLILNTGYFACLLFTGSRSGFLGLVLGLAVFWSLVFFNHHQSSKVFLKSFLILNTGYLILVVLFGSPFAQINRYLPFQTRSNTTTVTTGTQLETGGTESGKIRQIVWKGAFDIFKHYPIFGSGVETFAYSYYNFRPAEHNLVSEWDFLYNKAHNEYLNYLSTTGIVGFTAYLLFIIWFIVWAISVLKNSRSNLTTDYLLLATFTGWLSLLVSNFFGFSVVITSLYFYLIPGFIFILSADDQPHSSPLPLTLKRKILFFVLLLTTFYLILNTINIWRADFYYSQGVKLGKQNEYLAAYQNLDQAVRLSRSEPVFLNELSSATANLALLAFSQKEATLAGQLSQAAISSANEALQKSPVNLNLWKTRVRVFYLFSSIDEKFLAEAVRSLEAAIKLAPTDPKLLYNLGLLYSKEGKSQEAMAAIKKSLDLKPNYEEAHLALALIYEDSGQKDKALEELKTILKTKGNDPEIEARIKKLEK